MMRKWMVWAVLALIILVAAVLRWTGLDWDGYYHLHPDERYIHWVATTIEWPEDWTTAFSPAKSTFNPYYWPPNAESEGIVVEQDQPRKFAYGHFPLYLGVTATKMAGWLGETAVSDIFPADWFFTTDILNTADMVEFRHLAAVTRAVTGLVDLGTIIFVFLLGRRLFRAAVGLLAAAFLTLNVMHIQLAHFFIVDPFLTFFTVVALYLLVKEEGRRQEAGKWSTVWFMGAAVFVGLAVGAKFSAVLLFLPLALTAWLVFEDRWITWWVTAVLIAFLAFFITNPFAVLDWSCDVITPAMTMGPVIIPRLNWASCYLDNISTQSVMVNGGGDIPFTRQYEGTIPYLYYLEMQLKWGMGPLLGVLGFAGFGWGIWQVAKRLKIKDWRFWHWKDQQSSIFNPSTSSGQVFQSLILLSWMVPFFLVTGSFYVKFMRYLQPLTPFLMLYGAAMVLSWQRVWLRRLVWGGVLLGTAVYALSFVAIYQSDHPWITASQWLYDHVPQGSLILSEQWDDALPISMAYNGEVRLREEYTNQELTWLTGTDERDSEAKLAANLALLAEADYVTLVTNRVYGVAPRLPESYPLSGQYHQLLFDGTLGYELVWVNGSYPHLGSFFYRPDTFGWPGLTPPEGVARYLAESMPGLNGGRVDESFVVYDQPLTLIFKNTGRLTAEEMGVMFE
ncbi:MAG: phospholipid carrier-dependent glycosyltransferase [Anaerolineae bacterium]|nr:phospholipid carrier-dependent glycosyltransferase [Anaerolineae bacterium]